MCECTVFCVQIAKALVVRPVYHVRQSDPTSVFLPFNAHSPHAVGTFANQSLLKIIDKVLLLEVVHQVVNISLVNGHLTKERLYSTYPLAHGRPEPFIRTLAS